LSSPKIENGEVPHGIKVFLDKMASRNSILAAMATTAEKDIARQMGLLKFWQEVEEISRKSHKNTRMLIAELWLSNISQSIMTTVHMLAIQDLIIQVHVFASPEFDAARRQIVKDEVMSAFNEIKNISDDLRKSQSSPDPRLIQ
jgi:hypothetical protein